MIKNPTKKSAILPQKHAEIWILGWGKKGWNPPFSDLNETSSKSRILHTEIPAGSGFGELDWKHNSRESRTSAPFNDDFHLGFT